jgi:3',5'-cyclic AMP phosphodiesterase CpdA
VTQAKPGGVATVAYWKEGEEQSQKKRSTGSWKKYNAGGFIFTRNIYHHRVTISDLLPGQTYSYQVGNGLLTSKIFQLRTLQDNSPEYVPKIAIYGDLGNENGQSIPWLMSEVEKNRIDAVFHIGDIAYDLADNSGKNGDEFMRRIEPIASKVPYMVVPGNHEAAWNFSHYDNLFAMMDQRTKQINNHFFTTTVGPVRVIGISIEFYYFVIYGRSQIGYDIMFGAHILMHNLMLILTTGISSAGWKKSWQKRTNQRIAKPIPGSLSWATGLSIAAAIMRSTAPWNIGP